MKTLVHRNSALKALLHRNSDYDKTTRRMRTQSKLSLISNKINVTITKNFDRLGPSILMKMVTRGSSLNYVYEKSFSRKLQSKCKEYPIKGQRNIRATVELMRFGILELPNRFL